MERWDEMVEDAAGRCGLCSRTFGPQGPCIDHCHETGRVRGLLCTGCNTSLGGLGDTAASLSAAVDYLTAAEFDLRDLLTGEPVPFKKWSTPVTKIVSVRFRLDELEAFRSAATAAGLPLNRWIRRACEETAAMERAVVAEDARVGLEREGWDTPYVSPSPEMVAPLLARIPERAFRPDPRPVSAKKPRR